MMNIESAAATGIPILTLRQEEGLVARSPTSLDNLPTNDNERDLL